MPTVTNSVDSLWRQWRRQILGHRDPGSVAARKRFVAISILDQANTSSVFVDIDRLLVVLLSEDEFHSADGSESARIPLRLSGYRVRRVPHGVQWGGAGNSELFKDLMLTPQFHARGQRIDRNKVDLLSLALKLDHRLRRAARHPAAPWPGLRLPRLWAGFRARDASGLRGGGPEFEQACRQASLSTADLWRESARRADGMTLLPMDWVSSKFERAAAVFAELTPGLRRQVFRIEKFPDDLTGFCGASFFDFYNSQFRRMPHQTNSSEGNERSSDQIQSQTSSQFGNAAEWAGRGAGNTTGQLHRWADQTVSA